MEVARDELALPLYEDVKAKYDRLHELMGEGKIHAAYAVERGGILAAAAKMGLGNGIGTAFQEDISLKPVSYTHLDVYKRQAQKGPDGGHRPGRIRL